MTGMGKPKQGPDQGSEGVEVLEAEPQLKEPSKYAVVLLNDDFTPMDFVVEVLTRFFQKSKEESERIMLQVHHQGRGVAGVYTYEIAETKVAMVNQFSQEHGHPLKTIMEEV